MPYDPLRLTRQSWANPDQLAQELVFALQEMATPPASAPTLGPVPGRPGVVLAREPSVQTPASLARGMGFTRALLPVVVMEPPVTVTSQQASEKSSQPQFEPITTGVEPAFPATGNAGSQTGPEPVRATTVAAEPVVRRPQVQPTSQTSPSPDARTALAVAPPEAQAIPPELRTIAAGRPQILAPIVNPAGRSTQVPQQTPISPTQARPSKPVTDFAGLRPPEVLQNRIPTGTSPIDAQIQKLADPQIDSTPVDSSPLGKGDFRDWYPSQTHIPQQSIATVICQVDAKGVTAFTPPTTAQNLGVPGKGMAFILDFDGNAFTKDTTDETPVYNLSIFPLSGPIITTIRLVGEYWFLSDDVTFCHGIVTTAISPCAGIVPGTGKVQLYWNQGGSMVTGPTLTVENWYSIAAAVGKHCGLMAVDGMASLEVLDC